MNKRLPRLESMIYLALRCTLVSLFSFLLAPFSLDLLSLFSLSHLIGRPKSGQVSCDWRVQLYGGSLGSIARNGDVVAASGQPGCCFFCSAFVFSF